MMIGKDMHPVLGEMFDCLQPLWLKNIIFYDIMLIFCLVVRMVIYDIAFSPLLIDFDVLCALHINFYLIGIQVLALCYCKTQVLACD